MRVNTVHLKHLWKASFLVAVASYAYFVTTDTFVDLLSLDSIRPIVLATGLCAIAILYIAIFHSATRFIDGVLLLATCVTASWMSCALLNVPEPDINGIVGGVIFGVIGGGVIFVLGSLWCLKPGMGGKRKHLVFRSGMVAIGCLLIFVAIGWVRTKLTALDLFIRLVYPVSFGIVFVCAWLAVSPTAVTTAIKKKDAEVAEPPKTPDSKKGQDEPLSRAAGGGAAR